MEDRWLRVQIERRLFSEMQKSFEEVRDAHARYRDACWDRASKGVPSPDSNLQVTNEWKAVKRAQEAMKAALQRWTDFIAKGIIPEDVLASVNASPQKVP